MTFSAHWVSETHLRSSQTAYTYHFPRAKVFRSILAESEITLQSTDESVSGVKVMSKICFERLRIPQMFRERMCFSPASRVLRLQVSYEPFMAQCRSTILIYHINPSECLHACIHLFFIFQIDQHTNIRKKHNKTATLTCARKRSCAGNGHTHAKH